MTPRGKRLNKPKPPLHQSRASATRQAEKLMGSDDEGRKPAAPTLAESLRTHMRSAKDKVRRYWKGMHRAGCVIANISGLNRLYESLIITTKVVAPQRTPPQLESPATSPSGQDPTHASEESHETPVPRPLRVRFSSTPREIRKAPSHRVAPTSYRIEKPWPRLMDQKEHRRKLQKKLDRSGDSPFEYKSLESSRHLSRAPPVINGIETMGNSSSKNTQNNSKSELPVANSRPYFDHRANNGVPTSPMAKPQGKRSETDLSDQFQTLGLSSSSPKKGADSVLPRRKSSTRLSSGSRLFNSLDPQPYEDNKDSSLKAKKQRSLSAPVRDEKLPLQDGTKPPVDSSDSILRVSRRRSQYRILERQRAEEAAEAQRRARQARIEKRERARRMREERAMQAAENAENAIQAQRRGLRAKPPGHLIVPLSSSHNAAVDTALAQSTETVLSKGNVEVKRYDLGTLLPQAGRGDPSNGWLNDTIIDAAMSHVIAYGLERVGHQAGQVPRFHSYTPFFYSNFRDRGHAHVRRWGRRANVMGANLLQCEIVFVPVNSGSHWTLLVLYPLARAVEYYDSLDGDGAVHLDRIQDWLSQELGDAWKEEEWVFRTAHSPKQNNGRDCGVFVVTSAKMLMLGWEPSEAYGWVNMPNQRRRIAAEILAGGYKEDLELGEAPGRWLQYQKKVDDLDDLFDFDAASDGASDGAGLK